MGNMTMVIGVIVLSALFAGVAYADLTIGDLQPEIAEQLRQLQTSFRSAEIQTNCRKFRDAKVGFLLYTRSSPDNAIILDTDDPKQVLPDKQVIFLIHGWLANATSPAMSQLKDSYLKLYDANVIVVDWASIAWQLYSTSYCHVSKISHYVAKLMCQLNQQINLPLSEVHIVGHSMGAQIAGVVGQYAKSKCKQQVGRITGLDPSGPLFQNLPERRRLDKSDAMFVDVIHTDQVNLGYSGNIGHVDFHPNCGQHQPGCPSTTNFNSSTLLSDVMCSHHRSLEYMSESVVSDNFVAVSCGMCPRFCRANVINEIYAVMGESCRAVHQHATKFFVTTASSPPYAKGWVLYDAKLP